MMRIAKVCLTLALLLCVSRVLAADPKGSSSAVTEANVNPLPDLPRPPNMPPSLYEPTVMTPTPALPESPYFERDILLDPPDMPQAGWVAGEIGREWGWGGGGE